ncbi:MULTISPECIES: chloride channel protein [Aphanothece]|uniref:chloride channel protein n=1 Tax=Aphanothece TaxID=1121 RepID=UPI003985174C
MLGRLRLTPRPAGTTALRLPRLEPVRSTSIRQLLEHRWLVVVLALIVTGLGAATAALVFRSGLDGLGRWRIHMLELGPRWLVLPAIGGGGGLVAGLLVQLLAPAAQGSGIPQVMQFLRRQPIPMGFQVAAVKLVAGIVAIGSGFPLGPSGPSVQMGSSVGWEMARLLRAPNAFRRLIVAAGGGAGIAAVFRAPIGGFLYALEELLQGARPVVMLLVLVTTFWADTWADLLGLARLVNLEPESGVGASDSIFQLQRQVMAFVVVRPIDLLWLFLLGALVAMAAELYCRYVMGLQRLRQSWRIPLAGAMTATGTLLGLVDAWLPPDFLNRAGIRQAIAEGDVDLAKALAIFLVVFLTTGMAAAAGTPGGLFAPMLTLGGALGLAAAAALEQLGLAAPSTAVFAGMGAFMAACARAPISATFLTFAVTKELLILRPVLVACLGSLVMARLLHPQSLFKRLMLQTPSPGGPAEPDAGSSLRLNSVPLRPRPLETGPDHNLQRTPGGDGQTGST